MSKEIDMEKEWRIAGRIIIIVFILAIGLYIIGTRDTNNTSKSSSNSSSYSSIQSGKSVTLKDSLTVATSEQSLDKFIKFLVQKNNQAINDMYLNGELVRLPSNSQLNIVDSSITTMQIQYKENTYYTKADVLKDSIN